MIPDDFVDDGCSGPAHWLEIIFGWLGYNIHPACRTHDHAGCTRCWPAGYLTEFRKFTAAWELEETMRTVLPWWLDVWAGAFYRVTKLAWGYWDSCGPEAGPRCRHNQVPPDWMGPPLKTLLGDGGADL